MVTIRQAKLKDLEQITAIYNEAVLSTTATFDIEEKTIGERKIWFENRDENFPILVAEKNNSIAGYISLNKWSERKAYDITAEISVYVNSKFRGQGIGKLLVQTQVARAQESNLQSLIARITEGNEQSIYLHKIVGFEVIGIMKKAGKKFNKLLDVTFMQKMLK